jgi:hypothetical protein
MAITREVFDQQRRPRFGTANPERMNLEFWEWMIRGEEEPPPEDQGLLAKHGIVTRNGMLKSRNGPWRARDLFRIPLNREDGPIWTFDRMGQTCTELSDGRVIYIAGEHEDSYDPDFHIYNDVVVFTPEGDFEIYGYPKEVFPPTDFHTATLMGDRIVMIGSIGYPKERRTGHTPVYLLDLGSYGISEIATSGENPGWLHRHEAEIDSCGVIRVRGGEVFEVRDDRKRYRRSFEDYALDTGSWTWRKVSNRNWRQFSIKPQDRTDFDFQRLFKLKSGLPVLLQKKASYQAEPGDEGGPFRFRVRGVIVEVEITPDVEVVVKGSLLPEFLDPLIEEIRMSAEEFMGHRFESYADGDGPWNRKPSVE